MPLAGTRHRRRPTAVPYLLVLLLLLQVLAEHFYREGRFDLGDLLAREAKLPNGAEQLKAPYSAMHKILTQVPLVGQGGQGGVGGAGDGTGAGADLVWVMEWGQRVGIVR